MCLEMMRNREDLELCMSVCGAPLESKRSCSVGRGTPTCVPKMPRAQKPLKNLRDFSHLSMIPSLKLSSGFKKADPRKIALDFEGAFGILAPLIIISLDDDDNGKERASVSAQRDHAPSGFELVRARLDCSV